MLRGEQYITAFDISISEALRKQYPNVKFVQGSVNDMKAVREAVQGADVVYSTFAIIRYFERLPFQLQRSALVNVEGTNTVVEACIEENVPMLISTSTSNVCVTDSKEFQVFDETTPYVNMANAPHHYAYTKAQAEQLVLQANSKPLANGKRLLTAAVRPCSGIFGSRDRFVLQRFLERGTYDIIFVARIDWVYVDNVVWGHLLMEQALARDPNGVGGKPVCVSNNQPCTTLDMFNTACKINPGKTYRRLPRAPFEAMAAVLDVRTEMRRWK